MKEPVIITAPGWRDSDNHVHIVTEHMHIEPVPRWFIRLGEKRAAALVSFLDVLLWILVALGWVVVGFNIVAMVERP